MQRRHEIEEADPQEPNQSIDSSRDSPVQRAHLILSQHGKVDLQQMGNDPNRHISVDPCTRVFDQKPAQYIHHFTHEVSATDGGQIDRPRPASDAASDWWDWSGDSPR